MITGEYEGANDTEGATLEGKDKTQGREQGTKEVGVAVRDLHQFPNNRKGSVSSTYKKNADVNTLVYDLKQKTFHALTTWRSSTRSLKRL